VQLPKPLPKNGNGRTVPELTAASAERVPVREPVAALGSSPLPPLFGGLAEAHTAHVLANRQVRLGRGVGGLAVQPQVVDEVGEIQRGLTPESVPDCYQNRAARER